MIHITNFSATETNLDLIVYADQDDEVLDIHIFDMNDEGRFRGHLTAEQLVGLDGSDRESMLGAASYCAYEFTSFLDEDDEENEIS